MGLADSLAALSNVEPEDLDPEDQDFNGRINQQESDNDSILGEDGDELDGKHVPSKSQHYVKVGISKLRTDVAGLDPEKYAGAKKDRMSILGNDTQGRPISDESGSDEEDSEDSEQISSSEELENEDLDSSSEGDAGEDKSEEGSSLEDEDENGSEDEGEDEEPSIKMKDQRDRIKQLLAKEQSQLVNRLTSSSQSDALKGRAVEAQSEIYENLLDLRIKLQKALTSVNPLPTTPSAAQSVCSQDSNDLISRSLKDSLALLSKLSQLRQALISYDLPNAAEGRSKKRKLSTIQDAADDILSKDAIFDKFRKATLDKWSNRVQSASGASALQSTKFKALNQSASAQVDTVLGNMDRLIQRTQVNRSGISFLGSEPDSKINNDALSTDADAHLQTNIDIFDDSDYYKQLLKDFVDRRMIDSAASASGVKWAVGGADSNYNKKQLKPGIDRKASKGRRLRYDVKDKLQNYMAPRPDLTWTEDQMDDLFAGLLGRRIQLTDDFPARDETVSDDETQEVSMVPEWSSFLFAGRGPNNSSTLEA